MTRNPGAAMTKPDRRPKKRHAGVRVAVAAVAGLGAGLIAAGLGPWHAAELSGGVLAAVLYLASVWLTVGRDRHDFPSLRHQPHEPSGPPHGASARVALFFVRCRDRRMTIKVGASLLR